MDDQDLDLFFKKNLENHEVKPDPSNWTKINRWRPFAFVYAFSKSYTFKIAASLLFILTVSTLFIQLNNELDTNANISVIIEEPKAEQTFNLIDSEKTSQEDFVLDIESEETDEDVRIEIIEKEIDDYIAFLFADEDEFADIIDSVEIAKSLKLAEQLPLDDMFAVIPDLPKQEEYTILAPLETKIILPHRFVEADENIEDYLLIYEINQNNLKDN